MYVSNAKGSGRGYKNLSYLKSESEFRQLLDRFYHETRAKMSNGEQPRFKGLLEIMKSEAVIMTAIHKIKSNKGSKTPGSDGMVIEQVLIKDYQEVISLVRQQLDNYKPQPIRRKLIPKTGKKGEFRPLGIPTIVDRTIQEVVRLVIEPILEAQFYDHSYGFRPMRDTGQAVQYIYNLMFHTGYTWCVEGDISKFFDEVNHRKLLNILWTMGIRDQRVLMLIKQMLKAGILKECHTNDLGTPQGGIISPLLANAYLHKMDMWVTREWYNKKTKHNFVSQSSKIATLKHHSKLKPAYLIRYADDWVLLCRTKRDAEKWKHRIGEYLKDTLKLRLSEEKTLITDARKKSIKFLGFDIKMLNNRGKGRHGIIGKVTPNKERLENKVKAVHKRIRKLKYAKDREMLVSDINLINSQIRGIINYYALADGVNEVLRQYREYLKYASYKALKKYGGRWLPANKSDNLKEVHQDRTEQLPMIEYTLSVSTKRNKRKEGEKLLVALTSISFANWSKVPQKNLLENPYSLQGRELYFKRTGKRRRLSRVDEIFNDIQSILVAFGKKSPIYNFEYVMNRGYTFNRDRGCCRCCGEMVDAENVHIHHERPYLPLTEVNKVKNLVTTCKRCHTYIHNKNDVTTVFSNKVGNKILVFRDKLVKPITK